MGAQERPAMRIVGLDVGSKKYSLCEVKDGRVVQRVTTRSVSDLKEVLGPSSAPARIAIEACREAWHIAAVLEGWGHEVVLIDTTRVRQLGIGAHGRKTDRIDAEVLARALESGRVPVAHMLSPERQALRYELGVRHQLVETRAEYVTTVRHICRSHGIPLPTCTAGYFAVKLRTLALPETVATLVRPLVALIEQLDPQIRSVDGKLIAIANGEPLFKQLMTVPGVGLIVAAVFISVIDDARRFRRAHEVEAYLGLVPSEYSSGSVRRIGAITKHGNRLARCVLVEAAHSVLRMSSSDDPFKKWADAVRDRRGLPIAAVAVARRLAGILWALWRDDTVYEPARLGLASARGHRREAQSLQLRAAALVRAAAKIQQRSRRTTRLISEVSP
jgi:transposase